MENGLILLQQEERALAALKTSPEQYFADLHPKKIEDVFVSHEPAIISIQVKRGTTVARAAVTYLITELVGFFNAKETMSDGQIAMTADLILEEYPYFKTDDLKLCFRNAMKMKYGEIYNRIDGQVIMSWLKAYNRERCEAADNQSYNEHKALMSDEVKRSADGLFYEEYHAELERRADSGDKEAIKALEISNSITARLMVNRRAK